MKKPHYPLVLLCAALLFSGCAAGSTQNAPPDVHYDIREIERTPLLVYTDDESLFPAASAAFSAAHDEIALTLKTAGAAPAQELQSMLSSGETPDLVYLSMGADHGLYRTMAGDNALTDLSPFFTGDGAPTLYDGFLPESGPVTGAPMDYECAGLLVKAKVFTDGKVAPRTLDDLLAFASDGEDAPRVFGFPQDYPAYLEPLVLPMLGTAGETRLSTDDYAAGTFSTDEMKKLAESLARLSSSLYTSDPFADTKAVCTAFAEDKVLFLPGDSNTLEELRTTYGVTDDILLLPAPALGDRQYLLTTVSFAYVPAAAAHPQEALSLLSQLYQTQADGIVPPVKGSASRLGGYRGAAAALLEKGVWAYCGEFAGDPEKDKELLESAYTAIGDLVSGRMTPEDWSAKMDGLFESPDQA